MEITATDSSVLHTQFGILEDGYVVTARLGKVIKGDKGVQLMIEEIKGMPFSLLGHLAEVLAASGYKDGERVYIEIRMKRKV